MKHTPFRHYFLYAKGHYKTTDMVEDLLKIQIDYIGCGPEANIAKEDIIRVTTRAVESLKGNHLPLEKYVENLCFYGKRYVGCFNYEPLGLQEAIIATNLGIMRHASIDEIEGGREYILGEPDENLLPLSEYVLQRMGASDE